MSRTCFNSDAHILTLKERQNVCLETLLFFHDYCEKHNIPYCLAFGSLIGAVRHHGFIPWDDDIDVHVPRPDYERLMSTFEDSTGRFKLITCFNCDEYLLPFPKLLNCKTAMILPNGELFEQGIGIDLFPLDALPSDLKWAEKRFRRENDQFQRCFGYRFIKNDSFLNSVKKTVSSAFLMTGLPLKICKRLSIGPYNCDFDKAEKVGSVVGVFTRKFGVFDKSWFERIPMEFEGHEV